MHLWTVHRTESNLADMVQRLLAIAILIGLCTGTALGSGVVVISNAAGQPAHFAIIDDSHTVDVKLDAGHSRPFFTTGQPYIELGNGRAAIGKTLPTQKLRANAAYEVVLSDGRLIARQLRLGGDEFTLKPNPDSKKPVRIIPVSLWVDDELPMQKKDWEPLFRKRFAAAAKIVGEHSGVEFNVTRVGRWYSSNHIRNFSGTLFEFIDKVPPGETLAIGFSAQYSRAKINQPRSIAGTREPLDQHILVREWRTVSEEERIELLVHELGHFLGAAHSTATRSAMRPKLADGIAKEKDFEVTIDPANTLIMSLVGQELRAESITDLKHLSPQTRRRLQQIYSAVALNFPGDNVPTKYLELLMRSGTR